VSGRAREVECLEHHLLLLGEVAAHPGDRRVRPQRAEAARVVVRLEDGQRVVDHLLRGADVAFAHDGGLREGHERAALRPAVALLDCRREDLLHLARDRGQVAEPVGCPRGQVAAPRGRLELHGPDEVLPRGAIRLPGEGAQPGLGQRLGRLPLQLHRRRAVQLGQ
jgi:hypothetical protein